MIDGVTWDGKNPKAYAAGFKFKAVATEVAIDVRHLVAASPRCRYPPPTPVPHLDSSDSSHAAIAAAEPSLPACERASGESAVSNASDDAEAAQRAAAYIAAELRRERVRSCC
jgi:hypothetical protein